MDLESCGATLSARPLTPVELARKLRPNDEAHQKAWIKVHQRRLLDKGKIEKLVVSLRSIDSANPEVADRIRTEADYFGNADRMRYPVFRRCCRLNNRFEDYWEARRRAG